MTETSVTVHLEILTPWLCASGRGGGQLHDAVPVLDEMGLPYVPGRHLKGLLRDAVERMPAITFGNGDDSVTIASREAAALLFGPSAETGERNGRIGDGYFFGLLRFSSATLDAADQALFLGAENAANINALFMTVQSTAIDRDSGVADNKTLRSLKVCIPMRLVARIEVLAHLDIGRTAAEKSIIANWRAIIEGALPLLRAVGSNRNRGFGRLVASLGEAA